jgi:transcription antitermination factor NusG
VDGVERKLKVRVDIFDRQIPVELDLDQVEKLDEN